MYKRSLLRRRSDGPKAWSLGSDTEHEKQRKPGVRLQEPGPAVVVDERKAEVVFSATVEEPHEAEHAVEGAHRDVRQLFVTRPTCWIALSVPSDSFSPQRSSNLLLIQCHHRRKPKLRLN